MQPNSVLDHYQERILKITSLISEVVEIESPSHFTDASRSVVDWIENQFISTGADLSVERISVDDGDHIIVRAFPGDGPHTILVGHTDTVHPVGTKEKNPTRIEDDRFYGCGIFDMKSGIVMMIEAIRYFAETNIKPKQPLTIVLTCDEEVGSFTGRKIIESEAAGACSCMILEPSANGSVKTGRKGTGIFVLKANGVPAHAGLEPEKGANAVTELAEQISKINAIANPEVGTTVNVTTFRGGTTSNVIPETAFCEIDVRFTSLAEGERVGREIRSLRPSNDRVSFEFIGDINRPPLERTSEVISFYERAREIAATFGYELGETQVGGASDGNFVAALGIPVLDGLGPAGDGAHTLNEYILISDIAKRTTLLTLLLSK